MSMPEVTPQGESSYELLLGMNALDFLRRGPELSTGPDGLRFGPEIWRCFGAKILDDLSRQGDTDATRLRVRLNMLFPVTDNEIPDVSAVAWYYADKRERTEDPASHHELKRLAALAEAVGALAYVRANLKIDGSPERPYLIMAAQGLIRATEGLVSPETYTTLSDMFRGSTGQSVESQQ